MFCIYLPVGHVSAFLVLRIKNSRTHTEQHPASQEGSPEHDTGVALAAAFYSYSRHLIVHLKKEAIWL